MENIFMVSKSDLADFMKETVLARYENIEISAEAACEILDVSKATLDRWVKEKVLKPANSSDAGQRIVRKFNLAYLLSVEKKNLKKEYRSVRES